MLPWHPLRLFLLSLSLWVFNTLALGRGDGGKSEALEYSKVLGNSLNYPTYLYKNSCILNIHPRGGLRAE